MLAKNPSLEHVCWSHFMMGDFAHHHDMPETPPGTSDYRVCCAGGPELPDDFPDPDEHGHALMASTYCMGAAPAPVFDYTMEALFRDLEARRRRDSSSTSGSTTSDSDRGGGSGASSSSGASMAHSDASASPPPPPGPPKARPTPAMEWKSPSSSMTLANLYGLASSLNPGDEDLTPVQAWFELAERYDPATLIDSGVLESLKRELRGVVHCLYYGAVMERAAFESVLDRVMKGFPVCFL